MFAVAGKFVGSLTDSLLTVSTKRVKLFSLLETQWQRLRGDDLDALFGETKKKRSLELLSEGEATKNVAQLSGLLRQAGKDIELSRYSSSTPAKRTRTHPSTLDEVNEWWGEVLENHKAGHVGLLPEPFQPGGARVELDEREAQLVEHFARHAKRK